MNYAMERGCGRNAPTIHPRSESLVGRKRTIASRACRTSWFQFAALLLVLIAGCSSPQATSNRGEASSAEKPAGPAVKLVIDFDDGLEKHYALAWREGMTALDALDAAARRQRGIRFEKKGSGEMAMVLAIDGLANEGGGGKGRNWIYRVNGQLAEKSAGVYEVRPEDVILWTFGKYE